MRADLWSRLQEEAEATARAAPRLLPALRATVLDAAPATGAARLVARLARPVFLDAADLEALATDAFARAPDDLGAALDDLDAINGRNFEPGGLVTTWLGGRGFHILLAHRLAHILHCKGDPALAAAARTATAHLGADIHPAARFGRRIFLDHGVGFVVGETAVVEDDVSLWHGVTLGGTLMQDGDRHPKIRRGAVLGAGATVLGAIEVGEGSVVAAGSVVLTPVPPHTTVAGNPATSKVRHRHPYGFGNAPILETVR